MNKHTPGPWICITGSVYKSIDGDRMNVSVPIAHMDREPGNGTIPVERDQNARLIAAAPDLLGTLECIVEMVDGLNLTSDHAQTVRRVAVESIAKAKGE